VADWHWKVGFTPQTIRHGPRSWHFSSSVVLSSSEPGLLLGAQPRKCPLRGPYSIHILIVPSFGASVDHLWEITLHMFIYGVQYGNSSREITLHMVIYGVQYGSGQPTLHITFLFTVGCACTMVSPVFAGYVCT
jgi:hypothetical protein